MKSPFSLSIDRSALNYNIINPLDEEITTIETRLAKAKAIKQGMMQELLTGKTRLIQPQSQPDQGE